MSAFGGPEVLVPVEMPDLSPGPGEVRIAVAACGVHLVDTSIRSGAPGPSRAPTFRPCRVGRSRGGFKGLAERALASYVDGTWRPLVTTYPLTDAARAHDDLEQRRTTGKVVLVPAMSSVAVVGPLLHADLDRADERADDGGDRRE